MFCLATTSAAEEIIRKAGIGHLVDIAVFGERLEPPKRTSAACLIGLARERGIESDEVLFIDDCSEAIDKAHLAGVPAVLCGNYDGSGVVDIGEYSLGGLYRLGTEGVHRSGS